MEFLVDPVVYAVPLDSQTEENHICYIERLNDWSPKLRDETDEFFISEACLYALADANRYPSAVSFAQLWSRFDETDLGYDLALGSCQRLLMNTPVLEDRYPGLREIEVDDSQVAVCPDLVERLFEPIACAFRETLGLVAYAKTRLENFDAKDMMLVTHPIEGGPEADIAAVVSPNNGEIGVEAKVLMIYSPNELLDLADLQECWEDSERALEVMHRQLVQQRALKPDLEWASYEFAPSFNASILQHHYEGRLDNLTQIFRKIVLLLTGNLPPDGSTHHWLDKNKQRKAGEKEEWGAWRLHITGRPVAIRLHYWRRGNHYKFMQVGPHQNYNIDNP